ncbi:alpha-L-fucosidase [Maribellus sediminis]|uniref:alpha-L-fucosidase n=1 Tax=Maribellus sediminis TaxID=2696285 RepID=UPI00142F7E4C|nr:alpha-L-fucosidase [Maribellus sediminis]
MKSQTLTIKTIFFAAICVFCYSSLLAQETYVSPVDESKKPVERGKFEPTWESPSQYEVSEWFHNATFGIWAYWGPQCQPERGDWYARGMYDEGSDYYKWHVEHYGHPSEVGFKDVIHDWKAENWNPEKLVALYKRTGAQYFFAMANHHDNLDLWDSKYQEWNSVRVGPKKDIMTGWAKAAKKYQLPFGISVHASHAWTFYETAQGADTTGQYKGVSYDGKLTKADGKGTWWEGLDPQELYAQNHEMSKGWGWEWQKGVITPPSKEYCQNFYNRTMDLINKYNPDLIYFDDTALPLYPVSDAGLKLAAHYYNHNMATHNGKLEAVLFGKILTDEQKKCMVWDVERGAPDKGQDLAWQTCTCIGDWHYSRWRYDDDAYKSAATVVRTLVDIVSKNGNLLLNIPVRGDGSIDSREVAVLEGIAAWMEVNKESIFDTRPWIVFGEGPSVEEVNPMKEQGFNEGKVQMTAKDIRFNQKGDILYATILGVPSETITIKSLALANCDLKIKKIEMLGSNEKLKWNQNSESLVIEKSKTIPNDIAVVFKIFSE